ncbi:MAG: ATP-binding cassette domain-containing protein, partial [Nitrospira sp.]
MLCLMGRNGVGKTTTLKAITGLLAPRSGRVMLEGQDVTSLTPDQRVKCGLAYVPQGREILPHLTVRENLRLGFWARAPRSNGSTESLAFEEVFALFPKLTQIIERAGGV